MSTLKQYNQDQKPQNAASDQGLHYLPFIKQFLDTSGSKMDFFNCLGVQILWENRVCTCKIKASIGGSVGCSPSWGSGGNGLVPHWVWQDSFLEIDHEIFSVIILSLPLIQEGQLSVSGKRMCTSTG